VGLTLWLPPPSAAGPPRTFSIAPSAVLSTSFTKTRNRRKHNPEKKTLVLFFNSTARYRRKTALGTLFFALWFNPRLNLFDFDLYATIFESDQQ
jgi:hypothetical protein